MKPIALAVFAALPAFLGAQGLVPKPMPPIVPPPVIRVADLRADEQPVKVETSEATVDENAFFRRVKTSFVFTNPNGRAMQGEFEFPIPEGAFVCGYALEVNGEMVPGVVCAKEKARVAFENETRKGVDPGLVEQVKGNVWRTRIFPLNPKTPRKAEVEYVVERGSAGVEGEVEGGEVIYERDGDDIFVARADAGVVSVTDPIASFMKGVILWDASLSRHGKTAEDRAKLAASLPEKGDWQLVAFANVPSAPRAFTAKSELLKAIDEVVYDGGTDIAAAMATTVRGRPVLVFTDEVDTLAEKAFDLDGDRSVVVGSRPAAPRRAVEVRKVTKDEPMPRLAPRPSKLLATVWAARRMQDLAGQSDARKDEFLALGRRYGVAGPGLSLIVLETLQQWLDNRIEPPETLAVHAEWVRRRQTVDDPIAAKREQAEHETQLLRYWEERVAWWKSPKPRPQTPSSGLFSGAAAANAVQAERAMAPRAYVAASADDLEEAAVADAAPAPVATVSSPVRMRSIGAAVRLKAKSAGEAGSGTAPTVTLKAWDPKTPYLTALTAAGEEGAYAAYLKEREAHGSSPAYFLDCADWFFKHGLRETALRVISNLAEFKLEDVALWRTMGWRLRGAGEYNESVRAFRHALALRGEEAQSRRDLALILAERGKAAKDAADLEEALALYADAAFKLHARRSGRRGNDFQTAVIALEELNGLLAWCAAAKDAVGEVKAPAVDEAYRRDLPVKLRIVMGWDADETDIDIHVLEPDGEEAFYGHRRTSSGGFVSEDVTTGYGPEEYLKKDLDAGVYKVLTNYFASHQTALTGPATVQVSVYTDWATSEEKLQILTLRLDRPKDKLLVGEVSL